MNVDVKKPGKMTPLIRACINRDYAFILSQTWTAHDLALQSDSGNTALDNAVIHCELPIFQYLWAQGAVLSWRTLACLFYLPRWSFLLFVLEQLSYHDYQALSMLMIQDKNWYENQTQVKQALSQCFSRIASCPEFNLGALIYHALYKWQDVLDYNFLAEVLTSTKNINRRYQGCSALMWVTLEIFQAENQKLWPPTTMNNLRTLYLELLKLAVTDIKLILIKIPQKVKLTEETTLLYNITQVVWKIKSLTVWEPALTDLIFNYIF